MYLRTHRERHGITPWRRRLGRISFLAAMLASMCLAWSSLQDPVVTGCGAKNDCGLVLTSRWATFLGIPVGLLSFGLCAVLFFGSWVNNPRSLANFIHSVTSLIVIFATLWFALLQIFIVKHFCPWCCLTHGLAILGVLCFWRRDEMWRSDRLGFSRIALPLSAVVSLAVIQAMEAPRAEIAQAELASDALSQNDGHLYLHHGQIKLKLADLPQRDGQKNGPVAIMVSDFTCPHCLDLQKNLRQYEQQSGGRLNVVFLPGFQDPVAKEIHRLLLTTWRVSPETYWKITDALLSGELTANYGELMNFIKKNHPVRFELDQMVHANWAKNTLDQGEKLMKLNAAATGQHALPQLIIAQKILVGTPRVETIRDLAERTREIKTSVPNRLTKIAPTGSVTAATAGLIYEKEFLNLGKIPEGEKKTARFNFTNIGENPLVIEKISLSSNSTRAENWPQTIAPGEQGHFDIHFDSTRRYGPISELITVRTNRANESHQLFLEAEVTSPLRAFPDEISFSNIVIDEKIEARKFSIVLTDPRLRELGDFTSNSPALTSKITELEKGKKYEVEVNVDHSKLGVIQGELKTTLALPGSPEFSVPIYANVVRAVEISPDELASRASENFPGQLTWDLRALCFGESRQDFKVISAEYRGQQEVKVTVTDQEKTPGLIKIQMDKGFSYPTAQKNGEIIFIQTNHEKIPSLIVPIRMSP